ncbi:MAG: sigma-70 family RNA polymerase sigma factor [Phycisphaerae bacterium]|nr:sigma-70 family RNA polymerase sigma factor [Phycisphaerae bacterium]
MCNELSLRIDYHGGGRDNRGEGAPRMDHWADIVRQYSPLLRKTAYRMLGNDADAADCMQDVFVRAITLGQRQEVRNWFGLLRQMAVCRAMDMLRERLRRTGTSFDSVDWTAVPCPNPGPMQSAEARELAGRLRLSLAQLPAQQAEVFCLVCVEGLSHEDTAAHLGTTSGNVRVLLHRARERLRRVFPAFEAPAER